jgi:hypothetical protein
VQQRLDRLAELARRLAVERKEALEDGKQTS